jgi:predicted helicase
MITGYIYVRQNSNWDKYQCYKIGKTENIINRESTYITSEIERGHLVKIFEFNNITNEQLTYIDNLIKLNLREYNYYENAGTEFYKFECINKISNIFINNNIEFNELNKIDIDELSRKAYANTQLNKNINTLQNYKIIPYPYQQETIDKMKKYYKLNDIGRICWSCGLGKALLGIFFVEQSKYKNIVIGIPSIHLQKQMKNEILKIFNNNASILNIGGNSKEKVYLDEFINEKCKLTKFIITTYSSCHILSNDKYCFDLKISDEAHHLVGIENEKTKNSFHKIRSYKTLFMTATEKLIKEKNNINTYSMDNESIFGTIIDSKSINWAIENNKITDYNIIILKNTENEMNEIINNLNLQNEYKEIIYHKDLLLSAFIALKSIQTYNKLTHILIYTNTTHNADLIKKFIDIIIKLKIININCNNVYNESLHSNNKKNLNDKIDSNNIIKKGELTKFIESDIGIISSVYIFGEGFDCPKLNGVLFSDKMNSDIRIVQSALRPTRKDSTNLNKKAYIIIPYIESNNLEENKKTLNYNSFEKCKNIISQIRNIDENVEHKINVISLSNSLNNVNNNESKNDFTYIIENNNELNKIKLKLLYSKILNSDLSEEQIEYNYMKQLNIELEIKNKIDYVKDYVKEYYIQNDIDYIEDPELYFKQSCIWTNWYDFLGVDTTIFIQNKEEWFKFCKPLNIKTVDEYKNLCTKYKQLPINPSELYINFIDIITELKINKRRR